MLALITAYLTAVSAEFRATLTRAWWDEFAEAAWRQAQQYAGPFLVVVIATGQFDGDTALTTVVALAGAVLVAFLRRLAAIRPRDGAAPLVGLAFRVLSAFTGAVAGFAAVDGFNLLAASWLTILTASAATAGLAFLDGQVDPAASVARADSVTVIYGNTAGMATTNTAADTATVTAVNYGGRDA